MPILGTPYERGQSDIICSRAFVENLGEGLGVTESMVNDVLTMSVGSNVRGVSGRMGIVAGDEIKAGLKVYVQAANADEEVTIGAPVYVTAEGKFTTAEEGNTAVNAHARTTIVDCVDSRGTVIKGFAIDFANGL